MESLLIYLLKSSVLITLFFTVYQFLLKKNTFFIVNRHFFLIGIFFSLFLPYLEFTNIIYLEAPNTAFTETGTIFMEEDVIVPTTIQKIENSMLYQNHWIPFIFIFYLIGVLFFAGRLIIQSISLYHLLNQPKERTNEKDHSIVSVQQDIAPFSFFGTIVCNPSLHSTKELEMILTHEKIHVRQYHTLDLLLVHLFVIFQWINPFVWLYKKNLEQNLEFIADRETAICMSQPKEYQRALVNVSINNYSTITNNFYQSLIKNRIIMLNKKPSKNIHLLKYSILLPVIALFLWSFNTKDVVQHKKHTQEQQLTHSTDSTKYQLGSLSKDITKESTVEELTEFTQFLKKHFKVNLQVNDIKLNNNLITNLNLNYEDAYGNEGSFSSNPDKKYIEPIIFRIKVDKDGKTEEIGFFKPESAINGIVNVKRGGNANKFSNLGENPLYIINGKQHLKNELIGKTFLTSEGFQLFIQETAIKKYGNIAKDGAVVIEKAIPWESISKRVDDEYRKNHDEFHLISITDKTPLYVYRNLRK